MAIVEVIKHLQKVSFMYACADAKRPDAQAGLESGIGIILLGIFLIILKYFGYTDDAGFVIFEVIGQFAHFLGSFPSGRIVSINLIGALRVRSPRPSRLDPTDEIDMTLTLGSRRSPLTLTGIDTRLPASR